jgi:hypothetical protein
LILNVHLTVRSVATLVAIGAFVNSAELLSATKPLSGGRLAQLRQALSHKRLRFALASRTITFVIAIRAAAAFSTVISVVVDADLTIPVILLSVTSLYVGWVKIVGADGADQMTLLVVTSLGLALAAGGSNDILTLTLMFIAAEAVLAYTTAGIAKLVSPEWRSGVAVGRIVDTVSYGRSEIAAQLKRRPLITRALTWGTIAFELAMPLVFIMPDCGVVTLLVVALCFHVSCAFIMGLNDFVWAFASTFPAIWFTSGWLRAKF